MVALRACGVRCRSRSPLPPSTESIKSVIIPSGAADIQSLMRTFFLGHIQNIFRYMKSWEKKIDGTAYELIYVQLHRHTHVRFKHVASEVNTSRRRRWQTAKERS